MKIQAKLPIVFGLFIFVLGMGGLLTYNTINSQTENFSDIVEKDFPVIDSLYRIQVAALNIQFHVEEQLTDFGNMPDLEKRYEELNMATSEYEKTIEEFPEESVFIDDIKSKKENVDKYYKLITEFLYNFDSKSFNSVDPRTSLLHENFENSVGLLIDSSENALQNRLETLNANSELVFNNASASLFLLYILLMFGGLLAIFGSIILHKDIVVSLMELKETASEISEDLNTNTYSGNADEVQTTSTAFEKMKKSLKHYDRVNKDIKEELKGRLKDLSDLKKALDESSQVAVTDKDGIITYVNKKFLESSKYSRDELIGNNHRILKSGYHPPEFYENLWSTITRGHVWNGIIKNKAKDGTFFWVQTTILPVLGKNGRPEQYVAVRSDITKQKETEEKLQKAMTELRTSDILKNEFSSMVTHELKTPLTPIKGYCDMLMEKNLMGKLDPEQIDAIKEIENNAIRLERLIGDILDAQKLDMNKMSFRKKPFNLQAFCTKIVKNILPILRGTNIVFENNNSLKLDIISDEQRIQQVIENLVRNAIDFIPKVGGKIEFGTKVEDSRIIFYVKDNGVGIAEENKSHLFKKFYQVDTSHSRRHGGTGVGLTVCKGIVEALGGKIWFDSQLGKGTIFYFSIPIKEEKLEVKAR